MTPLCATLCMIFGEAKNTIKFSHILFKKPKFSRGEGARHSIMIYVLWAPVYRSDEINCLISNGKNNIRNKLLLF